MADPGIYINNMNGEMAYRSFRPAPLPPEITVDEELMRLLVLANKHLSVLETTSELIPSTELYRHVCPKRGIDLFADRGNTVHA